MQATTPAARLAPTPSGFLHRGNAANFALNALLAGKDGSLLLRIDDLDRARFREEYLEDVFRLIDWLGIRITDGPISPAAFHAHWSQQHRMRDYRSALNYMRGYPHLFACPCSRRELAGGEHAHNCLSRRISFDAEGVAWRIDTREISEMIVPDLVRPEGFPVALHQEMPDFAVRKKDGLPSYQLACVVDDVLFGINRVGRGEDLLASTAAQAVLSGALGYDGLFERIDFVHHPLVMDAAGGKLSKSAGAAGVSTLEKAAVDEVFALARSWLTQ